MAFAKKRGDNPKAVDPITDRARVLNDQIAALESQIKKLDSQLHQTTAPKFRSTTLPHGATFIRKPEPPPPQKPPEREPVFEEVKPVRAHEETASPDEFNDLGVRKYDLPGLLNRLRGMFTRPPASNPRLVTYLAAGGVRGLRPLRYEKRVARYRFIALVVLLLFILLIVYSLFLHGR
jgi:hypothetical protein